MQSATRKLHQLAPQVGHAKQIREYDGDRRKMLLSQLVIRFLKEGESSAAAEHLARSSPVYSDGIQKLSEQREEAERIIAMNEAEHCSFKAAQSLLSYDKETLRQLDG
jgi:hypothetical protein